MTITADDVWRLLAELIESQKETERLFQESKQEADRRFQETERIIKEVSLQQRKTDEQMRKTDRQLKELGKQIGGLSAKFGSFTEGLALPSMTKILQKKLGMDVISPRMRIRKGGEEIEIDVLAYSNGEINTAYVVEVKSHAKEEEIEQLKNILDRFHYFFPEHQNKKVYGILTAVDMSIDVRQKALQEGLYVARIHDDVFKLDTPKEFQPKAW